MEIWKSLNSFGYNGFEISSEGRFRREDTKRILKPFLNDRGYVINTTPGCVTAKARVHRLVAFAFVPNPDNKELVNHIDGDRLNNHVSNLEWVTESENSRHAYAHGLNQNRRYRYHCPKFDLTAESSVEMARLLNEKGVPAKAKALRCRIQTGNPIYHGIEFVISEIV